MNAGFQQAAAILQSSSNVWSTRLLQHDSQVESGDIMFSLCFPCAAAQAKSLVDRSDCFTNCLCWCPGGSYQYVRLAYGIDGVCGDDLAYCVMCSCCESRQILTEAKRRGNARSIPPQAGTNSLPWAVSLFDCSFCELLESCCCFPCVAFNVHQHMQPKADSCCFDLLCVPATAMYGQVRHHYGILSDCPCLEDVFLPVVCCPCALNRARKELQRHANMVNAAQIIAGTAAAFATGGYSRF